MKPRRRWHHSIRWRLVALFVGLALATTAVFLAGSQRLLGAGWEAYAVPLVGDYIDRLAAEIGSPPSIERAQALTARLPVSVQIAGPQVNWSSHPARRHWHDDDSPAAGRSGDDDRNDFSLQRRSADGHVIRFGAAGLPGMRRPGAIGWITLALLLAATAVAWGVVRHWLRPLQEIGAGAERFGQGDFEAPIPVRRHDELGDLAGRINAMAANLHERLDAQRALLLAISHELRSPLTRARLHTELLPESAQRSALERDLNQMRDLIADLLDAERLAAGRAALLLEPVAVDTSIRRVVSGLDGEFDLDLQCGDATCALDRARFEVLIRNLADNALRHGAAAHAPQLQSRLHEGMLSVTLRDHGPGVDAALLSRLGEAFYRPDEARARVGGASGVGLGLYLCRRIAAAHGGSVKFYRAEPGLRVVLTLPGC